MINYTKATIGKKTKTFKNPTPTRSKFNIFKYLSAIAFVLMLGVNGVMGQTAPGSVYDLSTGSWTLTGWSATAASSRYPVNGATGADNTTGVSSSATTSNMRFWRHGTGDPLIATAPSSDYTSAYTVTAPAIYGNGANGIGFNNQGGVGNGSAVLSVNTTNRQNIQVSWTGRTIATGARTYGIRLMYRIGTSGSFVDANGTASNIFYAAGSAGTNSIMPTVTLPSDANNAGTVQILWYYYNAVGTVSGTRPNMALDEITVSSTASSTTTTLAPYSSQLSGNIAQGASNVPLTGFTISNSASGDFTSITFNNSATATTSDLSNFRIFRDFNGDGIINTTGGTDASVSGSGAALSASNVFTISGETGFTTARSYLLVADVAGGATPARTITSSSSSFTTSLTTATGSVTGNSRSIAGVAPSLTAAVSANVDAPFNVTFADDATWRAAITSITVGGVTLTAGYSATSGQITFTPSASAPASLLQSSGSKSIVVIATGYANATVSQSIGFGAATKLSVTTQPTAPASNGAVLAQQPIITVQDQYNNTVTNSSASVLAAVGAGTWTLGGTATVAATSGITTFSGLTASSAAAVTGATVNFTSTGLTSATSSTFNIPAPAPANDLCASPTALTINGGNQSGTTVAATYTSLTSEPFTAHSDVWYTFTPSSSGNITITTSTTGVDYDLYVFSTCPSSATSYVTGGNAANAGNTSETLTFSATSSTTYIIRVVNTTSTAGSAFTINATMPLAPPTLTAAVGATVDAAFNVTFSEDVTWRGAITSITVGGTTLSASAYATNTVGQIIFTPSVSSLLQSAGSKSIVVLATGYTNATVSQSIGFGAATKLGITSQPTAPASNGAVLAAQPVVAIQDQYGNTVTSDNSTIVTAAVSAGSWTIGGTLAKTAVSGVATFTNITASSASAVASATIGFTSSPAYITAISTPNFAIPAPDYISLTGLGVAATENFNILTSSSTSISGIVGFLYQPGSSPSWSNGSATGFTYVNSGSPTSGDNYIWGNTAGNDFSVGVMTSGSYGSPNSLMAKYRNNTGSTINNLIFNYDLKRYRINSALASVQFFYSLDGNSWIAVTNGDISSSSLTTGTSSYSYSPSGTPSSTNHGVISISNLAISGLSITDGSYVYLRWNLITTGGNSQGIGIDNVSLKPCGNLPATSNLSLSGASTIAGNGSVVTVTSNTLADGNYTVTYNVSGTNTVASTTATMAFASGTGTFTTSTLSSTGNANVVNITSIAFTSITGCPSSVSVNSAVFNTVTTAVAYSNTQFTTARNITRNTTELPIYRFQVDVTNASATLSSLGFTTPATAANGNSNYVNTDITNFKAFLTTSTTFSNSTQLGSTSPSGKTQQNAGETLIDFTSLATTLNIGTYYIWLTSDVLSGAVNGRTIIVNAPTISITGSVSGTNSATGTQTIQGIATNYYLNTGGSLTTNANYFTSPNGVGTSLSSAGLTYQSNDVTLNIPITVINSGDITLGNGSKIVVQNGGSLTVGSSNTITGTIDVNDGGTLTFNNPTITSTLGTLGSTSSTVKYIASGAQTIQDKTYANLTISGGNTKTISGAAAVSGTLTINSSVLALGSNSLAPNTLTLDGSGTRSGTWGSTASTATYKNNTYFSGTGVATVTNNTALTPSITGVTGSQSITYGAASITLTGTVSATGPVYPANGETVSVTINGSTQTTTTTSGNGSFSVNFTTSTIPVSTYTITYAYAGSGFLNAASNNTSTALTVNAASNNWTGGTGNWNTPGNWSLTRLPSSLNDNITISSGTPTMDVNYTLGTGRTLTISGSGSLIINPSSSITIAGTADFGTRPVTVQSDATGTGSIGTITGSLSNATNVTVERYISGAGRYWRFLSSPVQSATIASWMSQFYVTGPCTLAPTGGLGSINDQGWHTSLANIDYPGAYNVSTNNRAVRTTSIRQYVEANATSSTASGLNAGWADVTTATTLTPGKGFRAFIRGPIGTTGQLNGTVLGQAAVTLSLNGTVNQGAVSAPTLTYSGSGLGWNLIGNPYPCAYDWTSNSTVKTNIVNTVHVFDATSNSYKSYNTSSGGSLTSGYIPSGAAFFVQATGSGAAVTFNEAAKVTGVAPTVVHKGAKTNEFTIKYSKDSTENDEFIAMVIDNATLNKDGYDIIKLGNENLNLSSYGEDTMQLTLSAIPQVVSETRIKLNVEATAIGTYNFDFKNMDNFQSNITVSLFDRYTNKTNDVRKNTKYTFDMGAGVNQWGKNRFELILNLDKTNVDEFALLNQTHMLVYPNPATDVLNISINNATFKNSDIVVYNISGTEVLKTNMAATSAQLNIETLSNGVYFVKVSNQNGFNKTVKFVK